MELPAKIKWSGCILFAGLLLVLATLGGNWGTTYVSGTGVILIPHISTMQPSRVRAGTAAIVMVISGSNFIAAENPRVRLTAPGVDVILSAPIQILPDAFS